MTVTNSICRRKEHNLLIDRPIVIASYAEGIVGYIVCFTLSVASQHMLCLMTILVDVRDSNPCHRIRRKKAPPERGFGLYRQSVTTDDLQSRKALLPLPKLPSRGATRIHIPMVNHAHSVKAR